MANKMTSSRWVQAKQLIAAGNTIEAKAILQRIVQEDISDAQAWHQLGLLACLTDDLNSAFESMVQAVKIEPNQFLFHRNLGEVCRRLGRLDQAILSGKAACELAPNDWDSQYNLALAYGDREDDVQATLHYRKAIKISPNRTQAWNNLGALLEKKGDLVRALAAYEKATSQNPNHAEAHNNQGSIYHQQGRLSEARASFDAALLSRPDFIEAHYNLSLIKTYQADDPQIIFLQKAFATRHLLAANVRVQCGFALGKALDDAGHFDLSFEAYEDANCTHHALHPMDEESAQALFDSVTATFTKEYFAKKFDQRLVKAVPSTQTPIFIVGMPRSGTTLLEQILATLPGVYGAGELVDLHHAIQQQAGGELGRGHFTASVARFTKDDLERISKNYMERVWKLSPNSRFISDKMLANFMYIGLIYQIFPHAKVINVMRDPMDSCFSCYSRFFNETMDFVYDQGTLGRYYRRYRHLMQHWREVLPQSFILDLHYEEMVGDLEKQARRVLDFIGIDWDPCCLEFYNNDRLVKTASVLQVRRPVYNTSVARWKHFAKHLRPLYALVKEFRNSDEEPQFDAYEEPSHTRDSSMVLRSSIGTQRLVEQCLALQGKGEHASVLGLLSQHLNQMGSDAVAANLWHLHGISCYRLNAFEKARASYERAVAAQPQFANAFNSLGFLLQDMGLMLEAQAAFERAVTIAPDMAIARLNLAMAQLKLGNFADGWANYEARWVGSAESINDTVNRPRCPLPQWNGESNTGSSRLLVITEQGFGDTFQFVRYLPLLADRFKTVGFVCPPPTLRLMEWRYSHQIAIFTHMPLDFSPWDWQIPLLSVPRALKTRVENIPSNTPYLQIAAPAKDYWANRLELTRPGQFKVGIAWAGRKAHQYDSRRSLMFEQILPLLQTPDVAWVSLQKWAPNDVRPTIPSNIDWIDWTEELIDFADTAALVSNLDLVISVDSAMVHLAGAIGQSVWMLNRFDSEWRWFDRRTDSPWYPSLKIFNQHRFGDWSNVLGRVAKELNAIAKPVKSTRRFARAITDAELVQPAPITQQPISVSHALQVASQYQVSGQLNQAQAVLGQVLKAEPRNAHALHLLGVVAYQAGRANDAFELIRQAIVCNPQQALFESNLAEMCRQQGLIDEAVLHGQRAIEIDPSMASAYSNLGIALYDAKSFEQATQMHEKALAIDPDLFHSLNNMGSIERAKGDKERATHWYRKALVVNGNYLEAKTNLGAVMVEQALAEEAIPLLLEVLESYPNSPEALCNLGLCYLTLDKPEQACSLFQRSLQHRPNYPEATLGLSQVLQKQERCQEAIDLLEQVIARDPTKVEAWCQLGTNQFEMGNSSVARESFDQALLIDSASLDALSGLANLANEAGEFDQAKALLTKAIEIDPQNLAARFHLIQNERVVQGDGNIEALESMLAQKNTSETDKKVSLHYALGKAHDDLKQYDQAFPHFLEGARLKRGQMRYSSDADTLQTQRIMDWYSPERLASLSNGGFADATPIFVLGMPRSGTTLTEQILASHPLVHGAGELKTLMEVMSIEQPHGKTVGFPGSLGQVGADTLTQWGQNYMSRLREHSADALRITDKMPINYLALGMVALILPNASIIHVQRNPLDTCLSCFTCLFNRHQEATYDLAELGRHYVNYVRIMQHWRQVLPAGAFLEVRYEDIIADTEGQSRRLIEAAGLPWDARCLDFHKNKRAIRTASVKQVRQPIYQSSIDRWRRYEQFLGPLLEELSVVWSPTSGWK